MHIAKWTLMLSLFWLLLSGYIQPLLLIFGALSVALVIFAIRRMDATDREPYRIGTGLPLARYLPWLFRQIFTSSAHVTRLIWGAPSEVSPALGQLNAANVPPSRRTLYTNSITLTPGTLSIDLVDDNVTVHALQASSIQKLEQGDMEEKITSLWGEKK